MLSPCSSVQFCLLFALAAVAIAMIERNTGQVHLNQDCLGVDNMDELSDRALLLLCTARRFLGQMNSVVLHCLAGYGLVMPSFHLGISLQWLAVILIA